MDEILPKVDSAVLGVLTTTYPHYGNCSDCEFFHRQHEMDLRGECRRHAPVVFIDERYGEKIRAAHPPRHKDDGCGDFRRKREQ